MRKFADGTQVRATIIATSMPWTFDGVVESYDENEGGYWVRTEFSTARPLTYYIPTSFARRLFAIPDTQYWKILRTGRQLENLIYDDGLDNWI